MIKTLENIEVVEGTCGFCDYYYHCGSKDWRLCKALIGKVNIFKKKETWVPCTKENTKVGDTIMNPRGKTGILKYISDGYIKGSPYFDCLVRVDNWDIPTTLSTHKIRLS